MYNTDQKAFLQAYEAHLADNQKQIEALALPVKHELQAADQKPGMMLVTPGNVPFLSETDQTELTGAGSGRTVGHAVIIAEDPNYVIEAVGNGKGKLNEVVKSHISSFLNNDVFYVIRGSGGKADDAAGLAAARYAERQVGKPYNWNFLNRKTVDSFYCSQLCWRSWLEQGYRIDYDEVGPQSLHIPKTWVSPNDLIAGHFDSYPLYRVET